MYNNISILPKNSQYAYLAFKAKTSPNNQPALPNDEVLISSKKKKSSSIPWKSILTVGAILLVAIEAFSEHKVNKDLKAKIQDIENSKKTAEKFLSELDKDTKKFGEDLEKQKQELEKILKSLKDNNKK